MQQNNFVKYEIHYISPKIWDSESRETQIEKEKTFDK